MTAPPESLVQYVPVLVAQRYANGAAPALAPSTEGFSGAALFADITGFTALAEQLARRGPVGAEELGDLLNRYFRQLIALIEAHGGDVVKFAGDGLLAVWNAGADGGDLALTALRAIQCGLEIQHRLDYHAVTPEVQLRQRVTVGAGDMRLAQLGGELGRWELLISGAPLGQLSVAQNQTEPGEVVASPEAWALVADRCTGVWLPTGAVRAEMVRWPLSPIPLEAAAALGEGEAALRAFIPGAILARLAAGQSAWLAELRRVTVLFAHLPGFGDDLPLELLQPVMRSLQAALYRHEGSINKLSVDDKGVNLVAALGLPPLAHEDDALRGVNAALAVQAALRGFGLSSSIGVAAGQVFCGAIGGDTRREYTLVGSAVNLAARLMQAAGPDGILCDENVRQAASGRMGFLALPPLMIKGRAAPVAAFVPAGAVSGEKRMQTPLVGRVAERRVLEDLLLALANGESGGTAVLEGEAGIGKSRLLADLFQQADRLRVGVLPGSADPVERSTPYYAWRGVFSRLLDVTLLSDPAARWRHIQDLLEFEPELQRLAPLLGPVLALDVPDNETTFQMTGQVRADNTREFLISLLQASANRSPKVLALEDAQWMDSASWALALAVSRRVRPLLLIVASRPLSDAEPPDFRRLVTAPDTRRIQLGMLSAEATAQLVRQRLGVTAAPESVEHLIYAKAGGHPFYSEELAGALLESGVVQVERGVAALAPGAGDIDQVQLPDSVSGVILSRIDRLSPQLQLTLKVASVIGRAFASHIVQDIHPIPTDRDRLFEYLTTLERLNWTMLEAAEPNVIYLFKHVITQEVAYNLMLYAQRRELHRAVAEWYEQTHAADLSPYYGLLAHHWSRAEDGVRAIAYLERAGELALHNFANQEAIALLSEALRWDAELGGQTPPASPVTVAQRARWERQLGEAYHHLGRLAESRDHLMRSLALLGWPLPSSARGRAVGLLREITRQAAHRLTAAFRADRSPSTADDSARREAARSLALIGEICYFSGEIPLSVYGTLRSLNLAENAGDSPELAHAYANATIVAGFVPLRGLAETYSRRARETAERSGSLPALAHVLTFGGVYLIGVGQLQRAHQALERAAAEAERLGDWRQWTTARAAGAVLLHYEGRFAESGELGAEVVTSALRTSNLQQQAWGLYARAQSAYRLGRLDEAGALAEQAAPLYANDARLSEEIRLYGLLAAVRLRQGDRPAAQVAAAQASRLMGTSSPYFYAALEGYAGLADVYFSLCDEPQGAFGTERDQWRSAARHMAGYLQKFARIYPVGRPRALMFRGAALWLDGRQANALAAWQSALAEAERLTMRFDQALVLREIGRRLTGSERRTRLNAALRIFDALDARTEAARVRELLAADGAV